MARVSYASTKTNRRIRIARAAKSRRKLLDILLHAGMRLLEGASHQLVKKHRFTATDRAGDEHRVTARCRFGGREQIHGCGGVGACARGEVKESGGRGRLTDEASGSEKGRMQKLRKEAYQN